MTRRWPLHRRTLEVRDGWDALAPHASGVDANVISDEGAAGVESAYGDRLARLTALEDAVDPTIFVRLNANLAPIGAA